MKDHLKKLLLSYVIRKQDSIISEYENIIHKYEKMVATQSITIHIQDNIIKILSDGSSKCEMANNLSEEYLGFYHRN